MADSAQSHPLIKIGTAVIVLGIIYFIVKIFVNVLSWAIGAGFFVVGVILLIIGFVVVRNRWRNRR